jgi:hypothetical protein
MAAKKRVEDLRKQRDARAKKILLILMPVLIALVAWQGPKVLKQVRGEAPQPQAAADTQPTVGATPTEEGTTASPETATTSPATTAPATTAPAETGNPIDSAVPISAQQTLPDTDQPPPAAQGQLITFSRFEARDPFVQLVDDTEGSTNETSDNGSTTGSTAPSTSTSTPVYPTTVPTTTDTGTTTGTPTVTGEVSISVNGTVQVLAVNDTFPESDPAFKVISISGDSVEIGLVNGSFSSGQQTVTLRLGEPVTLISQPDGARFTLRLVKAS